MIIESHPELLIEEADLLIDRLISSVALKDDSRRLFEFYRELIRQCRKKGIDATFMNMELLLSLNLSEELQFITEEISQPASTAEIPRRIMLCQKGIDLATRNQNRALWAVFQVEMGIFLFQNPLGNRTDNIEQAIYHYNEALKVYTQEAQSLDWAATQNNLAAAYKDRIKADKGQNIERAIYHCSEALKVYTQEAQPLDWAAAKNNLGNAFNDRILGNHADNIEHAIQHYNDALKVYTLEALPQDWGMIQNNLAIAYKDRIKEDRAQNIEQAIHHCNEALKVRTQETSPQNWAATQTNLAYAYSYRIMGDRAENIELAIYHYNEALKIYTQETLPQDWAMIQNNLATAYNERIKGDRPRNIEQAIHHCKEALKVYTQDTLPQNWAETQISLARAFHDRVKEDRAHNIEESIYHYSEALKIYTQESLPQNWLATLISLGSAYNDRIRGDRADNVEQAIRYYNEALNACTKEAQPQSWAAIQNNLANAYNGRIMGNLADNIEQAINHCIEALKVYTQETLPCDWAMSQNSLANAYKDRIRGDRVDNIERAIYHYNEALKIYTQEALPLNWAMAQNNLAAVYMNRLMGDHANNIEQAIHLYNEALKVRTQETLPQDWAITQNNLATAYIDRVNGDRADNIEQAIYHYNEALRVRTLETLPQNWAATQNNFAAAYINRLRGDRSDNIEQAIYHYNEALKVRTKETLPRNWAMTQGNLAVAYSNRIKGDRTRNLEQAIHHCNEALSIYDPDSYPNDCRRTARILGSLYFKEHRWNDASDILLLSKDSAERLYHASLFMSSRDVELLETGDVYRDASYALARASLPLEAAVSLEQGRARGLGDALDRDRADLERVRNADPESYDLYQKAATLIRNLELSEKTVDTYKKERLRSEQLREEASNAYADLNEATERIRRIPGYEAFLKEPDKDDIAVAVTDDMPLVYLVTTTEGSLALIAANGQINKGLAEPHGLTVEPIWLDSLKEVNLLELLNGPTEDKRAKGWFGAYYYWLSSQESQDQDAYENSQNLWFEVILGATEKLWIEVMKPLVDYLCSRGFTQAILIPSGYLALLPLHAASWLEDGERHYALEKIALAYAPSARSLAPAIHIARSIKVETLLAIDEPDSAASPLPSSEGEVNSIVAFFNKYKIMRRDKAERNKVLESLTNVQVAHFSCHGSVNWQDPDQSGLLMARDQMITIQDIFQLNLKGARMATLSACETGVIGTKLPDEVIALPSAFMRAGFAGAVSSLWTVEDESAAILMKEFYKLWQKDGLAPILALNEAQKRLRENERFKHPFYWAAFYLTGV